MNKGFTLIEMLAASVLFILILLLAIPAIMNQVNDKKDEISESTLNMIYAGAKLYMEDHHIIDNLNAGDNYCVSLDKLVQEEYLDAPIKDSISGDEISLAKYVKTKINPNMEYDNFELVDENC